MKGVGAEPRVSSSTWSRTSAPSAWVQTGARRSGCLSCRPARAPSRHPWVLHWSLSTTRKRDSRSTAATLACHEEGNSGMVTPGLHGPTLGVVVPLDPSHVALSSNFERNLGAGAVLMMLADQALG